MKLDEPFEPLSLDLAGSSVPPVAPEINSPWENELVHPDWLEEPTRVMKREELDRLLEQERLVQELVRNLHTRPTVRSMQAVLPPSSRPPVEVTVVDSGGRPVEG